MKSVVFLWLMRLFWWYGIYLNRVVSPSNKAHSHNSRFSLGMALEACEFDNFRSTIPRSYFSEVVNPHIGLKGIW